MSYRVVTKVTFTPEFSRLTDEEQTNEQIAAMEIVARNGGTFEYIIGTEYDDVLLGGDGTDEVCGRGGRDEIEAEAQAEQPIDLCDPR